MGCGVVFAFVFYSSNGHGPVVLRMLSDVGLVTGLVPLVKVFGDCSDFIAKHQQQSLEEFRWS